MPGTLARLTPLGKAEPHPPKKRIARGNIRSAFLGNETYHLHGHVIPRYKKQIEFKGIVFEDKLYGHNYQTNHDFDLQTPLKAFR